MHLCFKKSGYPKEKYPIEHVNKSTVVISTLEVCPKISKQLYAQDLIRHQLRPLLEPSRIRPGRLVKNMADPSQGPRCGHTG